MSTQTTSKALLDTLRWESSRTDIDQKPLRRVEWAAIALHESAAGAARYHAAFEHIKTADDLRALVLDEHDVADAKAHSAAMRLITGIANMMDYRRTTPLLTEWVGILAERYPDGADALRKAAAL